MLAMPVHVGSHCPSDAGGSSDVPPELRNRIANSTSPSDGTIVPAMKPHLPTPAKDFTPPNAMNVDSQYTTRITRPVNRPLLASAGLKTYASADAKNASCAGYHTTFCIHC